MTYVKPIILPVLVYLQNGCDLYRKIKIKVTILNGNLKKINMALAIKVCLISSSASVVAQELQPIAAPK